MNALNALNRLRDVLTRTAAEEKGSDNHEQNCISLGRLQATQATLEVVRSLMLEEIMSQESDSWRVMQ